MLLGEARCIFNVGYVLWTTVLRLMGISMAAGLRSFKVALKYG